MARPVILVDSWRIFNIFYDYTHANGEFFPFYCQCVVSAQRNLFSPKL